MINNTQHLSIYICHMYLFRESLLTAIAHFWLVYTHWLHKFSMYDLHMCVCTMRMPSSQRGQQRAPISWGRSHSLFWAITWMLSIKPSFIERAAAPASSGIWLSSIFSRLIVAFLYVDFPFAFKIHFSLMISYLCALALDICALGVVPISKPSILKVFPSLLEVL